MTLQPPPSLFQIVKGRNPAIAGVVRFAATLARQGANVRGGEIWSDRKPYCDSPVRVKRRTDPRDTYGHGVRTLEVSCWSPCRKCEKCLTFKRMRFRQRIMNEIAMADSLGKRTWFVTLTFSPVHLAGILAERRTGKRERSVEQVAYSHVQRYFKRLRKWGTPKGVTFRYAAVAEYGEQNGRLHFHLLLHESGSRPIPKRILSGQWRSFVSAKLVRATDRGISGAASYLAKYATKMAGSRLRSSQGYGTGSSPARAALPRRAEQKPVNCLPSPFERLQRARAKQQDMQTQAFRLILESSSTDPPF